MIYPVIRSYACESQAFVISSHGILGEKDFPDKWKHLKDSNHTNYGFLVGGSAIVNPHGRFEAGPLIGEETILYADCHAHHIKLAKALFDCLGHYTRWDVARLQVRKEPWTPEAEMVEKPSLKMTMSELRRISEEHEISMDKLEAIVEELTTHFST